MARRFGTLALLSILIATGCTGTDGPLSPIALPTAPPSPTLPPSPPPTPSPLPPVPLTVNFPVSVSALNEVAVAVELPGLAERDPAARVWARVTDPNYRLWWESDLEPAGEGRYTAPSPLHLPLVSPPGEWRLMVFVEAATPVEGEQTVRFRPDPVTLWDLEGQVREGVTLRVPKAFDAAWVEGDGVAGGRVWARAGEEVGLWWIPGPTEPLTQDTARMVVEATHPPEGSVEVLEVEPVEWAGLPGFRFDEQWPEGPAEALVVQGPDRWLYLLRVRAVGEGALSPLLLDIQASLQVEGG